MDRQSAVDVESGTLRWKERGTSVVLLLCIRLADRQTQVRGVQSVVQSDDV